MSRFLVQGRNPLDYRLWQKGTAAEQVKPKLLCMLFGCETSQSCQALLTGFGCAHRLPWFNYYENRNLEKAINPDNIKHRDAGRGTTVICPLVNGTNPPVNGTSFIYGVFNRPGSLPVMTISDGAEPRSTAAP